MQHFCRMLFCCVIFLDISDFRSIRLASAVELSKRGGMGEMLLEFRCGVVGDIWEQCSYALGLKILLAGYTRGHHTLYN